MATDRAYLIGITASTTTAGRHRDPADARRETRHVGRHRASAHRPASTAPVRPAARPTTPRPTTPPSSRAKTGPGPRRSTPRTRALPAGLATLLTILAGATAVSGWFAASGASAVASMIAH